MTEPTEDASLGRRRGQIVLALVFLAFALFVFANLPGQVTWVAGARLTAQPGFWPAIGGAGMVVTALAHLRAVWRRNRRARRPWISAEDWAEVRVWAQTLEYCGWFLAYVFAVPVIGHLPATLIFAPALVWRLGYRNRRLLWATVVFAVAVVLIFRGGLAVKIPGGAVYEYLPDPLRGFALRYL